MVESPEEAESLSVQILLIAFCSQVHQRGAAADRRCLEKMQKTHQHPLHPQEVGVASWTVYI